MVVIWTKKYMLRPVAHCSSGCVWKDSNQWAVSSWQKSSSLFTSNFYTFTLIMKSVIYLSLITASLSFTVTETKVFEPLREWTKSKNQFFGKLISCGYCFGHWVAFVLVVIYQARLFTFWWLLDYFITALVVAWLAAFQWALMCWLMGKTGK